MVAFQVLDYLLLHARVSKSGYEIRMNRLHHAGAKSIQQIIGISFIHSDQEEWLLNRVPAASVPSLVV